MKFEQAFYTWGKHQLSQFKEGLGVCASSNLEKNFLERCVKLGSHFNAERSLKKAEFVLYSPEFESFVGVGISQGKGGGDGRTSMLCHFFIPCEQQENPNPSEYFLLYPFRDEVEDGEELCKWEGEAEKYNFYDILEKYDLKGIKLAKFLQMTWPCMFEEKSTVRILIDRKIHEEKEDSTIAREITWLLSMLVPGKEDLELSCRKNLSYGVYTRENVSAVRLIFASEKNRNGENVFYLDKSGIVEEEKISQVFIRMSSIAEGSLEKYKSFAAELFDMRVPVKFTCTQLPIIYIKWKLNRGEHVYIDEIKNEINGLLNASRSSIWHRELLENYLLNANDLGGADAAFFWKRFITPRLNEEGITENEIFVKASVNLLKIICKASHESYVKVMSSVPEEERICFIRYLYEEPDSIVKKYLEKISSGKELYEFLSLYRSLSKKEEVRGEIFDISKRIYKEAQSEERNRITDTLLGIEELREDWEAWIRSRIEEARTTDGYLFFVEQEAGKMELRYAGIYYSRLYDLAREKGQEGKLSENEEEQISKCEKEIRDVAGNRISEQQMDDFVKMIRNWKIKRINRKIAELPAEELAEYEIEGSAAPECIAQWINCAVQRLRTGEHLMEESYQRFLDRIPMISHWKEERKIGQLLFDKYLEALWGSSDCEPRGEMLKRKMLFRLKNPSFEQFSVWSRVRADEEFRDFQLLDEITGENPELAVAVENESDGALTLPARLRRVLYRIWKSVTAGEEIKEQDLRRLNRQTCKGRETEVSDMLRQFQKICRKDMEDGKEHRKMLCFINYMLLLERREGIDDRLKKGQKDRCRRYRKRYEKGDLILNFAKNEVAIVDVNDDWIEQRVREIGTFLSVIEFGEITEDNIKAVSLLVKDCRTIFSEKIDEVERLKKERQDFMDECRRQIASLEEKKKKIEKRLNRLYKTLEDGGDMIPEKREEDEDIRDILKASEAEPWIPSAEEAAEEEDTAGMTAEEAAEEEAADETIAEETTSYKQGDSLVENLPTCVKDNMPDKGPESIDISGKSNRSMQKPSGKDAGEKTTGLEGQRGKITKLKLKIRGK